METLKGAVCLRCFDLCFGMGNLVDDQIQLIILGFCNAAIFCTPVGENTKYGRAFFFHKWHDFIIEGVRSCDGRFGSIELGVRHTGLCFHIHLLVETACALHGADIESIL